MDEDKKRIDEERLAASLTRREWLVSLGSAVVLSGFPGVPGQIQHDANTAGAALPPGLYEPSFEHLSHALAREAPFLPVPPGTESEYRRPRSGPFVPQGFAPEEFAVVRHLVEIILGDNLGNAVEKPPPGTPASIYDEVAEWIDLVVASAPGVRKLAQSLPAEHRALAVAYFGNEEAVRHLETCEPERVCHEGLAWLGEESQRHFAKGFLDVVPAGQLELVRAISDVRADKSAVHAGTRLFDFLKQETIRGFYTSRAGLRELDYKGNTFYSKPPGCGPTPESQPNAGKLD